ncbi:MAG: hypothetical protein M1831_003449 [Alyxoria varia]|nr:MAG: hypothetical protein M1831_003449 [Alyxoria varia]
MLPRPDIQSLGLSYRRIPILAHNRNIYLDTRLQLQKLEDTLFPSGSSTHRQALRTSTTTPDQRALIHLLTRYTTDAGIFTRAAQLIPPSMPLMKDPRFLKDRTDLSGRPWNAEAQEKGRAEALVHFRELFELLEKTLLADGREWILGTKEPGLADIEAVWPVAWVLGLKGALPESVVSRDKYPKVFDWVDRFLQSVEGARKRMPEPVKLKGKEAVEWIENARLTEDDAYVDPEDPTGLKMGQAVKVFPIDSGSAHKDDGKLVKLTKEEVALMVKSKNGREIRVHAPRWQFRVTSAESAKI